MDVNTSVGRANRQFDGRSDFTRNYAEISLTQMLFDGFRVRNRLARFEHTSRVRYYELLDEVETKALEASEAYLDVLRHRELVRLAQNNVDNHLQVQQRVGERSRSGVGNRADLQQIDGRLALARSNLMTEIANLQSVTARFQRLVGRAPGESLAAVAVPAEQIPESLESVLGTGYANNPALFAAFENTQTASAALKEVKAHRYPTFELGMRQGIYRSNNGFDNRIDPDPYGSENIIELRGRYNLYQGGSNRAAERAAHRRINQAESLRDKACVDLRQTTTIAYTDVLNLQEKRAFLAAHRDALVNVVGAYRDQFDIGRRSLLDVLDSENEAFQAERAYVAGNYDLQLSQLRTLHGMGRLLQSLALADARFPLLEDSRAGDIAPASNRYCTALADAQLNIGSYARSASPAATLELTGDTLFDSGSPVLREGAVVRLRAFVARVLKEGPALQAVAIVGHTDSTGSAERNRELSLARAVAVRDLLIEEGIAAGIITTAGAGPDQPIASNATAEGRAANRRVELRVRRAE